MELLVRPDDAEREHRTAVVGAWRIARRHCVGDDAQALAGDAQRLERLRSTLAVHDDPLEAGEERTPEPDLRRRASREHVVRGQHARGPRAQEEAVELRGREPLHVDDVCAHHAEPGEPEGVLDCLDGDPQPRPSEEPRGERVEELPPPVAVRRGHGPEAEARRDELDFGTGSRERGGELVIVGRRERGRVGENDAHAA